MESVWIVGYIIAGGLIWSGLAKWKKPMRASTKQLTLVAGLFVLCVMIGVTLNDLFHWWSKFPKELIGVAGVLLAVERTIHFVLARRRSGALLLDLGRVPAQDLILNLFAGLALASLALMDIVQITRFPIWAFRDISLQILGLSIAYAVLLQGLSRRGLNERGVFFGTGLLPWGAIKSFHWEKESATRSMLVLHKQTSLPMFGIMTLSVKSESATSIEEVLRQHAAVSASDPVHAVEDNPA